MPPNHRLQLLGGLRLLGSEGPVQGPASQRHKLALLALLARAPGFTVSRDRLMALLWPESDATQARSLLSSACYSVRKELGADVLLNQSDGLRLDPLQITVDLVELERNLGQGRRREAASCYLGPFLDGFHLGGSRDFQEWVDAERKKVSTTYQRLLEGLASDAPPSEAVEWRARQTRDAPYSPTVAVRFMEALQEAGEWPRALSFAQEFQQRLEIDLDAPPDPTVQAFAESLRVRYAQALPLDGVPTSAPPPEASPEVSRESSGVTSVGLQARGGLSQPLPTGPSQKAGAYRDTLSRRGVLWISAAAVAVVAVGAAALFPGTAPAPPDAHRVVIYPFEIRGGYEERPLEGAIIPLLTARLDGMGPLSVVPRSELEASGEPDGAGPPTEARATELAQAVHAGLYVTGWVVDLGETLELRAWLRESDGTVVAEASSQIARDRLPQGTDELVRQLVRAWLQKEGRSLEAVAAASTGSLAALRHFLEGEKAFRAGLYEEAMLRFSDAVQEDTAFALGWYRVVGAREHSGDWVPWWEDVQDARAGALASSLPPPDRQLIEASSLRRAEAIPLLSELSRTFPDNAEVRYQLGRALLRDALGGARRDREALENLRSALALAPDHGGASSALAFALARDGLWDEVEGLVRPADPSHPGRGLSARAYLALGRSDSTSIARILQTLEDVPSEQLMTLAAEMVVLFPDGDASERLYQVATLDDRPAPIRGLAYRRLADLAMARGRWKEARTRLSQAARVYGVSDEPGSTRLAILPGSPLSPEEVQGIRGAMLANFRRGIRLEGRSGGVPSSVMNVGYLSARLGDVAGVRDAIGLLQSLRSGPDSGRLSFLVTSMRAQLAWAENRPEDVVSLLETLGDPNANERYLMGRALESLGRDEEALQWFASFPDLSGNAAAQLGWRADALLRSARILARAGDAEGARAHYARFLDAWAGADDVFRERMEEARREMESL